MDRFQKLIRLGLCQPINIKVSFSKIIFATSVKMNKCKIMLPNMHVLIYKWMFKMNSRDETTQTEYRLYIPFVLIGIQTLKCLVESIIGSYAFVSQC